MRIRGPKDTIARAKQLRRTMTKPERLLWWALRRQQTKHHFRRQQAAGPYVLDFYCDAAALCVEVDGETHDFRIAEDRRRDQWLADLGILTIRIPAREVLDNLSGVVEMITAEANRRMAGLSQ